MDLLTISGLENIALIAGRVLIGFYFFFFAFWNFHHRKDAIPAMRNQHVPFASFVFGVGLCIQFITGLYVIFAVFTAISAAILVVFDIFATFIFHRFWTMEMGPARTLNTVIFIGNLTVTLGGLLLIIGLSGVIH
ncbi:MAG: hypothetical protein NTU49_07480 [Gammaproteobacteria bacterium]|nr:hypothetical protein [Gammaproteobacteria bacterium]